MTGEPKYLLDPPKEIVNVVDLFVDECAFEVICHSTNENAVSILELVDTAHEAIEQLKAFYMID